MDGGGTDSPPLRNTILGSFLGRGRPRNSSQSHIDVQHAQAHAARERERELSPGPSPPASPIPFSASTHGHTHLNSSSMNNRRRTGNGLPVGGGAPPGMQAAPSAGGGGGLSLGGMLRRRRSAGNMIPATPVGVVPPVLPATAPRTAPIPAAAPPAVGSDHGHGHAHAHAPSLAPGTGAFGHLTAGGHPGGGGGGGGGTHRIRLVPHLDSRRSLRFDPISRDLKPGEPALRIGRFTDRSGLGLAAVNALSTNKIAFKSKVVSRAHAEVWIEETGGGGANNTRFLIKDTKSSSGTFLNHVRLSAANTESRPHPLKDGDILQLGVDYQGGAEDIYKSVKIRVEIGREWQREANAFNTAALKNLRSLAIAPPADGAGAGGSTLGPGAADGKGAAGGAGKRRKGTSMGIPDCCICLFPVSIRQALFIAPCSHTFHYKCLRPLLEAHHPAFSCPLCRTFADLEEDVEVEIEEDDEFENPDGFAAETPLVPHPAIGTALPEEVMEEGVLADDLEAEEGDEVDELYAVPPGHHMRFAGAETEVEDNGAHSRQRSGPMDEDMQAPPVDDADADEMEVESSGEGVLGGATLQGKRKR